MQNVKYTLKSGMFFFWSLFLRGLLTILPITLTIAVISFSFKVLKGWLRPIYELEPLWLQEIPFSEFLLTFFVIFLIGAIVNFLVLKSLISTLEQVIGKIPLVRPIYNGIKQLVSAFNPHDNSSFKQVVYIEFPRKGVYSIGFMTSEMSNDLCPEANTTYYNVFVPTTPNPTAGFFFMVSKEHIVFSQLSRQEAMALIISGGIIQPERFK